MRLKQGTRLGAYEVVTAYKRPKPPADLARLARRNLVRYRKIAARARASGARVLLVWHPYAGALAGSPEPNRAAFFAAAAADGVPLLDLGPAYAAGGGGALYVDGLHLSVAGHAVAGNAIGARLADLLAND